MLIVIISNTCTVVSVSTVVSVCTDFCMWLEDCTYILTYDAHSQIVCASHQQNSDTVDVNNMLSFCKMFSTS